MLNTISIICTACMLSMSPFVSNIKDPDPVVIIDFNENHSNGNRGDTTCPVSGRAYSHAGLVAISFSSSLGTANIRIENLDTGYYTDSLVIASGSTVIPFTLSSGQWQVTVTLSDGTAYSGYFVL